MLKPTKRLGTAGYMSPEILLCDSETRARARRENASLYGKEVDCWAIGVLVYECLFECLPWELSPSCSHIAWVTHIMKNGLDFGRASQINGARRKNTISSEAMSFISSCLDMDPRTRITVQQMSSHPWITGSRTSADADVERHGTGRANNNESGDLVDGPKVEQGSLVGPGTWDSSSSNNPGSGPEVGQGSGSSLQVSDSASSMHSVLAAQEESRVKNTSGDDAGTRSEAAADKPTPAEPSARDGRSVAPRKCKSTSTLHITKTSRVATTNAGCQTEPEDSLVTLRHASSPSMRKLIKNVFVGALRAIKAK